MPPSHSDGVGEDGDGPSSIVYGPSSDQRESTIAGGQGSTNMLERATMLSGPPEQQSVPISGVIGVKL